MNVPVNVTFAATVIVLPEMVADAVEAGMLHWLLESVPLPPTGVLVKFEPLSFTRYIRFVAGCQMK